MTVVRHAFPADLVDLLTIGNGPIGQDAVANTLMKRLKLSRPIRRRLASQPRRRPQRLRRHLIEMLERRQLLAAQVFAPSPVSTETIPGDRVQFDVVYTALDNSGVQDDAIKTTGVNLRMHYDSSQVTPDIASIASTAFPDATMQDAADGSDLDGDDTTDRFVNFEWVDAAGNFPAAQNLPLTLFTADFDTSAIFAGSIVNFTASPPIGFDIQSTSAMIDLRSFDATDFVVNTSDDGVNFQDSEVTLREAILAANLAPESQTITFAPSVTQFGPATFALSMGELTIEDSVAISGLGADRITIDAGFASRIFSVAAGDVDVALSGLSLTGGLTTAADEHGGAIRFDSTGTLSLQDVVLASNFVQGQNAQGGGVYSDSGTIAVVRSDFSGNMAAAHGGAIATQSGDFTLTQSTLRANVAGDDGGAVRSIDGTINVSQSTVSGNRADSLGGAFGLSGDALVQIANSTIAFNTATTDGGGLAFAPGANVTLQSSIVAGNSVSSGTANDIQSTVNVNAFSSSNLIGDPNTAGGLTHDVNGNIVGQESVAALRELLDITTVLAPLADNGGPTRTHGLVAFSPAIDAGSIPGELLVNGGFETGDFFGWTVVNDDPEGHGRVEINNGTLDTGVGGDPFAPIEGQVDAVLHGFGTSIKQIHQFFVVPTGITSASLSWSDRLVNEAVDFVDPDQEFRVQIEDVDGNLLQEVFSTNPGDLLSQTGPNSRAFDITALLLAQQGQTLRVSFIEEDSSAFFSAWIDSVSLNVTVAGSDQRGIPFLRDDGGGPDIGAYERQVFDPAFFVVTTAMDELDFTNNEVSLREAIIVANGSAGAEEVTFDLTPSTTITLSGGELEINGPLTIRGLGQDQLTIDANQQSRVLDIAPGNFDVTIGHIGITGGRTTGINEGGGGIRSFSSGTLTLVDASVSGNRTEGDNASGGGVYASGGDLFITGSTISGNGTSGDSAYGGGIESNNGDLTITASRISGNSSSGDGAVGGGIDAFTGGSVSISYTTISGNSAADGGGTYIDSADLTITGTTISGNMAGADGGGLIAFGDTTILNSTISGNTAADNGGGIRLKTNSSTYILNSTITSNDAFDGGGIYALTDIDALTIDNSIVAGNSSRGSAPDLSAPLTVRSSLIGELQGTSLNEAQTPDVDGNLIGAIDGAGRIDPLLGPLANNGQQTETHALLSGSPAVDAGSNSLLPADQQDADGDSNPDEAIPFDQRGSGFSRVVDGDENGSASVDMGAFELSRPNRQPTFTASDPPAVLEDSGSQSMPFASFDPGDPSEVGQSVLAYAVTNISNPELFSTLPQIDTDGNLTFAPAADAFGTSSFDVSVQDNGGTQGGGVDTSEVQSFQIAVTEINDAPSFEIAGEVVVDEDSGTQTITGFASDFDPGPNEDGTSAASQVIHDEGADGTTNPLSTDNNNPTDFGRLAHGSNIVRGYVDAARTIGDVDVFTFTIDPGFQLDGIFVQEYAYITPPSNPNEQAAFLAIDDTNSFPYDSNELDVGVDESVFIGGTVFGLSDLPVAGGGNILPRAGFIAGSGFSGPLPAGVYTFYIQQTGPANTYALDLRVGAVTSQAVVAYSVSNLSDPSLFASQPQIDADGNLTFTPADDVSGTATFDVFVQDDGGTDNGGVDTSVAVPATITINAVNDAPSFTIGDAVTVSEDSGAQSITGFASDFDPGPNESGLSTATQVAGDEGPDGTTNPFSRDNNNPTDVGRLVHGSNIVRGFIDAALTVGDVDVFTFTIDPGFQLDGLFVLEFEYPTPPPANERAAFLAINDSTTFPYNAQDLDFNLNPDLDESQFLGGTVFGLSDLPGAGGGDILPRAGVITGSGFTAPLGAGTYTIYVQQTGPANRYALDFRVARANKQSIDSYQISNLTNSSLLASGPLIDNNGTLTFVPAEDANGTVTFDVAVQDDGGTDNGGVNVSETMRGTITINSVNDRPTFSASDPVAVLENSGLQMVTGFASGFDPGPADESGQTLLGYSVSNISNSALFANPPAIDGEGNLTYTPVTDTFGTSTFDVTVQDSGGTDNGGTDTSAPQTFTITVNQGPREDFGDAPSDYPVLLSADGARHKVGALFLGGGVDIEADGQPSAAADGDGDDEDGVVVIADAIAASGTSTTSSFTLVSSGTGFLDAWIDFSGDGDWEDAGEQIATSFSLTAGSNTLSYTVPADAVAGETAARFRLSSAGALGSTGAADDGEVEDYLVTILRGDAAPDATVNSVGGSTTLSVSAGHMVVEDTEVLFSAPLDSIGLLNVQGTTADERIRLDFSGGSVIGTGGLRLDGGGGSNTLSVIGPNSELDLTGDSLAAENISTIELGNEHVHVITIDVNAIRLLAPTTHSVHVVGGEVDPGLYDTIVLADADDWRMGVTSIENGRFIRSVVRSPAAGGDETLQIDLPHAWQNIVKAGDVNNNGEVTANDALVIINELARRAYSDAVSEVLSDPLTVADWPGFYYDQNGDDKATALDALRVINELARLSLSPESELQTVDRAFDELFSDELTNEIASGHLDSIGTVVAKIASFATQPATGATRSIILDSVHRDDRPDERAVDELASTMSWLKPVLP